MTISPRRCKSSIMYLTVKVKHCYCFGKKELRTSRNLSGQQYTHQIYFNFFKDLFSYKLLLPKENIYKFLLGNFRVFQLFKKICIENKKWHRPTRLLISSAINSKTSQYLTPIVEFRTVEQCFLFPLDSQTKISRTSFFPM